MKFGIFVEGTRSGAIADDGEGDLAYARSVVYFVEFEAVVSWEIGGEGIFEAVGGDGEGFCAEGFFAEHGFVDIVAVVAFAQDGDVGDFDEAALEIFDGDFFQGGVNGDPFEGVDASDFEVIEIGIGFGADEVGHGGDEEGLVGGDAAATIGLEAFGEEMHLEVSVSEALEIEGERGGALVIGF